MLGGEFFWNLLELFGMFRNVPNVSEFAGGSENGLRFRTRSRNVTRAVVIPVMNKERFANLIQPFASD